MFPPLILIYPLDEGAGSLHLEFRGRDRSTSSLSSTKKRLSTPKPPSTSIRVRFSISTADHPDRELTHRHNLDKRGEDGVDCDDDRDVESAGSDAVAAVAFDAVVADTVASLVADSVASLVAFGEGVLADVYLVASDDDDVAVVYPVVVFVEVSAVSLLVAVLFCFRDDPALVVAVAADD